MDMIEKVGRALADAEGYTYDPAPYDRWARAAIEAMREPTEAMLEAGEDGINSLPALPGHYAEYCWPAMIDAALPSPPVAEETK